MTPRGTPSTSQCPFCHAHAVQVVDTRDPSGFRKERRKVCGVCRKRWKTVEKPVIPGRRVALRAALTSLETAIRAMLAARRILRQILQEEPIDEE